MGDDWLCDSSRVANPFKQPARSASSADSRCPLRAILDRSGRRSLQGAARSQGLGKPLQTEFSIPEKRQQGFADLGEVEFAAAEFKTWLDDWFGERNGQRRKAIQHASAIAYYHHQWSVPVVQTLVCDDAGQVAHRPVGSVLDSRRSTQTIGLVSGSPNF